MRNLNALPTILEFHDVEASLFKTLKKSKKEINLMHFLQFIGGQYADALTCMTPTDYKLLIKKIETPREKLFLVPNGIDEKIFPYHKIHTRENIIIFLGNMFYPPNKQSFIFLCDNVLPLVRKQIFNIKLKAIGMAPESIKRKYKLRKNIIFSGEINNIKLFNKELGSGMIGMATVFSGSGMKVKILNYCANGLPVITTSIGASGYENIKNLIIVKPNSKSIADAIVFLLKHKKIAKRLGEENRQSIIKEFSWKKITGKMVEVYNFLYQMKILKSETINISTLIPFWLEEGRDIKEVLSKSYKINNKKIYELDEK